MAGWLVTALEKIRAACGPVGIRLEKRKPAEEHSRECWLSVYSVTDKKARGWREK
jgi:hypothetical protein